ncbi:type VI secretion system ImpA family N-terminal domain-containing protein [Scandinavium sp. H11S7]|uniref:Type VI secretion system ImpA family N-terminal domain-containing protein n=1 Tax=Scandinavium hiltneri TaxID=2926519 RepID=A0ABT2E837_9ENTR|nr:VasL domain-containing protein [Scandinavium hiltneri]MCS2163140.1 type VI secretion system ImpA family N-terminal domain-containing protein [Scandinavium hiltneri]
MKAMVNLKALKINGHDPRLSKAFLLLSSDLSPLNGTLPTTTDWHMLEDKCFQLFRDYGYDLQNGVWFCLIAMRLNGWAGLAQSLELLSTAFTHNNLRCWPPVAAAQQRQQLIDWFCANVATQIYTLEYGPQNNGEMRQVERCIGLLCEYAKGQSSRSHDSLRNLHYFLQVRCRSVPYPPQKVMAQQAQSTVAADPKRVKEKPAPVPSGPQSAPVVLAQTTPSVSAAAQRPLCWALSGLAAGICLCLSVAVVGYYLQLPALSETLIAPVAQLQQRENALESAWRDTPAPRIQQQKQVILQQATPALNWLSAQSSDALFRQGDRLANYLELAFPNNQVSTQWRRSLKEKSGSIPALDGYIQANAHLDALEARLLNAERSKSKYMTVSELKTAVYQIRQDLQRNGIAAETLLWEMQSQKNKGEAVDPALLKQFSQRIDALNSHYFILTKLK